MYCARTNIFIFSINFIAPQKKSASSDLIVRYFQHIKSDWLKCQYLDENFKTEGGESQKDVRERFSEAFYKILEKNKGKRIAIFSHGYAITFFIMKWCKFEYVDEKDDFIFTFKDKIIFNKKVNAPEVFKLEFDENNELIDINNIEFNDLQYKDGMGK